MIKVLVNGQLLDLADNDAARIIGYIKGGDKSAAIKCLRAVSGLNLIESKELVDLLEKADI